MNMSITKIKKAYKTQKYSDEDLFLAAKLFKSRTEFALKDSGAYSAAQDRELLDIVCDFMGKKKNQKVTDQELKERILKFKFEKDLIQQDESAYKIAKKRKLYEEFGAHLIKTLESWTNEKVLEKARSCKDREEFYTKENKAYHASKRLKCDKEAMAHMPPSEKEPWKDEELYEIALSCKNPTELRTKNSGAYYTILKRELSEEYFAHMGKPGNNSNQEQELIDLLRQKFPKLTKLRDRKVKIEGKPHIQGFDIDIYIPELRKGIEFDGFYWHSVEGLKRSRNNWPIEDLENYHKLKDSHFSSKGIQILHIQEMDWYNNSNECIKRIEEFLK